MTRMVLCMCALQYQEETVFMFTQKNGGENEQLLHTFFPLWYFFFSSSLLALKSEGSFSFLFCLAYLFNRYGLFLLFSHSSCHFRKQRVPRKMFELTRANITCLIVSILVVAPTSCMLLEELSPGNVLILFYAILLHFYLPPNSCLVFNVWLCSDLYAINSNPIE